MDAYIRSLEQVQSSAPRLLRPPGGGHAAGLRFAGAKVATTAERPESPVRPGAAGVGENRGRERAGNRRECCLRSQALQHATFHVDHVWPGSEAGSTTLENLALAADPARTPIFQPRWTPP